MRTIQITVLKKYSKSDVSDVIAGSDDVCQLNIIYTC